MEFLSKLRLELLHGDVFEVAQDQRLISLLIVDIFGADLLGVLFESQTVGLAMATDVKPHDFAVVQHGREVLKAGHKRFDIDLFHLNEDSTYFGGLHDLLDLVLVRNATRSLVFWPILRHRLDERIGIEHPNGNVLAGINRDLARSEFWEGLFGTWCLLPHQLTQGFLGFLGFGDQLSPIAERLQSDKYHGPISLEA